jgi:hypothetical protein
LAQYPLVEAHSCLKIADCARQSLKFGLEFGVARCPARASTTAVGHGKGPYFLFVVARRSAPKDGKTIVPGAVASKL